MMIGIVKSKTLPSGAIGEFWKISKVYIDLIAGTCQVTLSLYIDVAAYNGGKSPLTSSKVYNLSINNSDVASGDIRSVIWTKIKTKAATTVSLDLAGLSISPRAFDPDIDGGTDVIV